MHGTRRQNNILDLVISTEEELIVNLKIADKIGDHQTITFSIKTENGNIASEKKNFNFRRQISNPMFEQPIVRNKAELRFEILQEQSQ